MRNDNNIHLLVTGVAFTSLALAVLGGIQSIYLTKRVNELQANQTRLEQPYTQFTNFYTQSHNPTNNTSTNFIPQRIPGTINVVDYAEQKNSGQATRPK